jgi:GNAT superfamily N-acetyltransferase
MYAEVGAEWVRSGFFSHGAHIMAGDTAARDALVNLGFGHKMVAGMRRVADPPPPSGGAAVEVREAGRAEEHDIHRLEMELDYYHSRPPMFMPVDSETEPGARSLQKTLFDNPGAVIYLAYEDGRAIGMTSLMSSTFLSACLKPDKLIYLYQGIVSESARSGGAGEALLRAALSWAAARGFEYCALHYHAANPTGGAFWRKHGFGAIQYAMQRHVDDRVAWARDWR